MVLLSYIGGKARVAHQIADAIPQDINVLVSPFFGSGSVEFVCAGRGVTVLGYDIFSDLVRFWQVLKTSRLELADQVMSVGEMSKTRFNAYRRSTDTALGFFVVNKCCFNGIMSGSFSRQLGRRFSSTPARLRKFVYPDRVSVQCQDFVATLTQHKDQFLFLDPPYYGIKRLYGLRSEFSTFDHESLAVQLDQHIAKWLLVYNDHPWIRQRYSAYYVTELVSRYGSNRPGHQLLISNYIR